MAWYDPLEGWLPRAPKLLRMFFALVVAGFAVLGLWHTLKAVL